MITPKKVKKVTNKKEEIIKRCIASDLEDIKGHKIPEEVFMKWKIALQMKDFNSQKIDKARITRQYSFLKSIQVLLDLKAGEVIQFLNWVSLTKNGVVKSKLNPFLTEIGSIRPPKILFLDIPLTTKLRGLQVHARTLVRPYLKFKDTVQMKHFLSHLEFIYKISIVKKRVRVFRGLFWFQCEMVTEGCPFHIKMTQISENHEIVLSEMNLTHNHDPLETWIQQEGLEKVNQVMNKETENLEGEFKDLIKSAEQISQDFIKKKEFKRQKIQEEDEQTQYVQREVAIKQEYLKEEKQEFDLEMPGIETEVRETKKDESTPVKETQICEKNETELDSNLEVVKEDPQVKDKNETIIEEKTQAKEIKIPITSLKSLLTKIPSAPPSPPTTSTTTPLVQNPILNPQNPSELFLLHFLTSKYPKHISNLIITSYYNSLSCFSLGTEDDICHI